MRSFNVKDNFYEFNEHSESSLCNDRSERGNVDLSISASSEINKHYALLTEEVRLQAYENIENRSDSLKDKIVTLSSTSLDTSTGPCLSEKSDEVRASSDDCKSGFRPVFLTSIMENSNNAVDSVPLFRATRDENVFKLPISELSFNGTIKHVQKLQPIVDPLTALSTVNGALVVDAEEQDSKIENANQICEQVFTVDEKSVSQSRIDVGENSGDSQYQDKVSKEYSQSNDSKWNLEKSSSSFEESFDSGLRSPDMFLDDDEDCDLAPEPFWNFLDDVELFERKKIKKIEEILQGVLPPPSVTTIKTDVTQMLKKYYCFLPAFNGEETMNIEENSMTPTKKVSFIKIPEITESIQETTESVYAKSSVRDDHKVVSTSEEANSSMIDRSIELKMCSESEVLETPWPAVAKCRFYDIYYNLTAYSEKHEVLMQKLGERFIGAETDTSVSIHSDWLKQSRLVVDCLTWLGGGKHFVVQQL
ncbi:unnamed protein product [Leptidea sinapis]|uniref:Uncharacterized protein n=1 Tax=Leptidea sinapis TaxID=189913 RepID=A0A5E4R5Z3_9NEOP|nr:unnamed protein product [Leptidea sinapis]